VNLETAITRAREFYNKEQRNAANVSVATKDWGFVEDSSNGAQTIAALISFCLMSDEGSADKRTVRLTQEALRILLDVRPDSSERAELIKKCALAPKIHKQIWDKWGTDLPSDAQLRHSLLFEWETPFNENAVDYFIAEYKSTIAFAKIGESDIIHPVEVGDNGSGEEIRKSGEAVGEIVKDITPPPFKGTPALQGSQLLSKTHMQEFVVPLSDGTRAIFQWPTALSEEDILDLKDSLKIVERKITRSAASTSTPTDKTSGL
jgi:hypothetical protein